MSAEREELVVVVDDNPATRYSTGRVLRSAGFRIDTAGTGREGIAQAQRLNPDLIVLDINLPDIDGFAVCRELRTHEALRRTPVVYLSATFVDDIDKAQGVDAGADGYLTHPVEAPVLIGTVNALLRARRAEAAVQDSEARFAAVFENALNGIAILSDDLVFVDANPSLCRILGRPRDGVVGRHLSAFAGKEHESELEAMATTLRQEGSWRGRAPVLGAHGEHVELEWNVSAYAVPHLRLAVVSDVTQRMQMEAERERLLESERQARLEAETANRVKDEFLAALSHELRTPLNAIVGFSRLLQRSPAVAADDRTLAHVNAIERNAWVQAQLISDLLDISRITSGKLQLDRRAISAADVVDAALASIHAAARAKRITLETDLDRDLGPVWWDPSRFQQVVWNLVDNAVKFSSVGGIVHVRLQARGADVELAVSDSGQGISPEFLPHVFDRFRQEDSTSRRGHGGLGLGLAIVHQLVSAHGGTITAESVGEGHGARFVVRLPRRQEGDTLPAGTVAAPATTSLAGCRVLIVDDNDDARALLAHLLGAAEARVVDVSSADAALAAIASFEPHVIISDLAMPHRDGFDLIRHVRAAGRSPGDLPAIALSAFGRVEDHQRAVEAGYQLHIAKPPDPDALLAAVARLVGPSARG